MDWAKLRNLPWRDGSIRTLQNWLISDPLYQFFPFLVNATETIRHMGHWPIWNPRILLGHPILADGAAQVFYPVFIALGLAFGAARREAIGLWLHVSWRQLSRTDALHHRLPLACCDLGRAHVRLKRLSGNLVRNHLLDNNMAWIPGILWAFELAVQGRRWRYIALGALALALAVLGGQFSFAVTFSLFLILYACGRTWELSRQTGHTVTCRSSCWQRSWGWDPCSA